VVREAAAETPGRDLDRGGESDVDSSIVPDGERPDLERDPGRSWRQHGTGGAEPEARDAGDQAPWETGEDAPTNPTQVGSLVALTGTRGDGTLTREHTRGAALVWRQTG
jgi:hypothetical protein